MNRRIDLTLPHHPALGFIAHTQPRRQTALEDRTTLQIHRDLDSIDAHAVTRTAVHDHFRRGVH